MAVAMTSRTPSKVESRAARVARALSYAHENNVVHRDIKPAQIMYQPESDQVEVTDFGLARIADSSKTKTGMVLGTPSYMSLERLTGKKIDSRSDLFSLSVMLYPMTCVQLPFGGDSMMARLMFKITNAPHLDLRTSRPDVTPCLAVTIDRTLAAAGDQRYQVGTEMARDLRSCMASTQEGGR